MYDEAVPAFLGLRVQAYSLASCAFAPSLASHRTTYAVPNTCAAVFAAVAMVTVRKLSSTEPAPRIVLYFAALALLLSGVPAWFRWEGLGIHAALIMLGVGLCATAGQLCLTRAYALARAAEIGTLVYCTVPFAAALGWLFWGEAMDRGTLLGAICVIGAGALANRWRKS